MMPRTIVEKVPNFNIIFDPTGSKNTERNNTYSYIKHTLTSTHYIRIFLLNITLVWYVPDENAAFDDN